MAESNGHMSRSLVKKNLKKNWEKGQENLLKKITHIKFVTLNQEIIKVINAKNSISISKIKFTGFKSGLLRLILEVNRSV